MATVINDLTIEPKAAPAADEASKAGDKGSGGGKSGPELERELFKVKRREHDRSLRMWAY